MGGYQVVRALFYLSVDTLMQPTIGVGRKGRRYLEIAWYMRSVEAWARSCCSGITIRIVYPQSMLFSLL